MTGLADKFRNAILCEDIRDEVGGKHSLMGVFGGDVTVPVFPATLQLAIYLQYQFDQGSSGGIDLDVSILQNDSKVAGGKITITYQPNERLATIVLPKALVTFNGPSTFRVVVSTDENEAEVLSKQIQLGSGTISPIAISPPS